MEILKLEIAKLEMKPGDVLVLRTPMAYAEFSGNRVLEAQEALQALLPHGCQCMILDTSAELSIITSKESQQCN